MPSKIFPADFDIELLNESEKKVLEVLIKKLPDDSRVYPSVDGFARFTRREIDFVVVIPGAGVALLEVKNGFELKDGKWTQYDRTKNKRDYLNVSLQLDAERELFQILIDSYLHRRSQPRFVSFLVLTDLNLESNQVVPKDIERSRIIPKNQLEHIVSIVSQYLNANKGVNPCDDYTIEKINDAILNRGDLYEDFVKNTSYRAETVESLTMEQAFVLDMLEDNSRVYINGGPGTGKTILAIEMAHKLSSQGKKVGLVCFNHGLSYEIKNRILGWNQELTFQGTVKEGLAEYLGVSLPVVPEGQKKIDHYWEKMVPKLIKRASRKLAKEKKFDAWVVDEAQDISPQELENLERLLQDKKNGAIYLFGDPRQNIFKIKSSVPWHLAHARLMFNVRCTASIANLLNALTPNTKSIFVGDTSRRLPAYVVVENRDEIEDGVDEAIKLLLKSNWEKRNIAVVATGQRLAKHDEHRKTIGTDNEYWSDFINANDVFYSRLMAFKGLERPAVVVAFNSESQNDEEIKELLFTAAGRARDELVLVLTKSDLDFLKDLKELVVDYRISSK
ncbi:MAG: hypothetical protein RLZZ330_3 [Actinomycetota bacterium]|jgi:hypothetical protein